MDGFFLIDKPLHITSFFVVKQLRKILNTKKIGHTGTLDPLATGLLLVACGHYTKLIPYFEKDTKEYEFEISLDGETDSYDLGTPVRFIGDKEKESYSKSITEKLLKEILKKHFYGSITQVPPKYSALKINGKMAVRMVKSGEVFELKERKAEIHEIELLSFKYPKAKLRAKVSAGTYIRTIADDLGKIIGCGAYVTSLRRTKIGKLDLSLSTLVDETEKPLDIGKILDKKRFIKLDNKTLVKMNDGMESNSDLKLENGKYFVTDNKDITNIVEFKNGRLKPLRRVMV